MSPPPPSSNTFVGVRVVVTAHDDSESHSCCFKQLSPSTTIVKFERSLAFKQWAHGICYRCLARDHLIISSCPDLFRCIRYRQPRHWGRHCPHRFLSSTLCPSSPTVNPFHPQQAHRWVDVCQVNSISLSPQSFVRDGCT